MNLSNYEYQSEFVKKFVAQGRAEGMAEGKAQAVLRVLEARAVPVEGELRARIENCRDGAVLDVWLSRAVTAATAAEVVGE